MTPPSPRPTRAPCFAALAITLALATPTSLAAAQPKPPQAKPAATTGKPAATTTAAPTASATAAAKAPTPASSTAPAAPPPADGPVAWFAQGSAAHEAGKHAEAEALFFKVWAVKKAWDVAANLGLAELMLAKPAPAAEHLAYALRWFPASEPTETRTVLERRLADARKEIGTLKLTANVEGAQVRVGGELKGTTPLEGELFVAPGSVTVEVSKEGYEPAKQTLRIEKGGAREVPLTLMKQAPPGRSLVAPVIAFGVGGAGLVLGAITGGIATAKLGEIRSTCGEALVCPTSYRGEMNAANAISHVSTVGFVVAGLGAATGVVLLLIPASSTSGAQARVLVGPSFLGVKGSF